MGDNPEEHEGKRRRKPGRRTLAQDEKVEALRLWVPYETEEERDELLSIPAEERRRRLLQLDIKRGAR